VKFCNISTNLADTYSKILVQNWITIYVVIEI
jgi:hypothetical protein